MQEARSQAYQSVSVAAADELRGAYEHCWQIASSHYENFTVGSWLLPRRLRNHIAAIYAYARTADDFADEGELDPASRLRLLDDWEMRFDACVTGHAEDPVFVALADTISVFQLPLEPFRALLRAFRRDSEFQSFRTYDELQQYCRDSANPIGHLILSLFGYRDAERMRLSDQVCTGLQLANFWQDISVDAARGRNYFPLDELAEYGVSEADVLMRRGTPELIRLVRFQVERARKLLEEGVQLADRVDGRLRREVRMFAGGGLAILDEIERMGFDTLSRRPTVSTARKGALLLRCLVTNPRVRGGA